MQWSVEASALEGNEAGVECVAHKPRGIMNVQLLHQVGPMGVDRPKAQEKPGRDLSAGQPLGDEFQNLHFAFCQILVHARLLTPGAGRFLLPGPFDEPVDDDVRDVRAERPLTG